MLLVMVLLVWLEIFLKVVFFERGEDNWDRINAILISSTKSKKDFLSPVDGTILYINDVTDGRVVTQKNGINVREDWVGKHNGVLIGIYMSIFDRHFVINPIDDLFEVAEWKKVKNGGLPMMDVLEYIHFYYFGKMVSWFESKAFTYKQANEHVILKSNSGVRLMLIGDKFVNKITVNDTNPSDKKITDGLRAMKIASIRRGSQVDVFIPDYLFKEMSKEVGQKVKVGETLCQMNVSEY